MPNKETQTYFVFLNCLHCSHCMSETVKFIARASCIYYVIAWLGVKFGINFTSVVVSMAKIARGEAECNLPFSLQHK